MERPTRFLLSRDDQTHQRGYWIIASVMKEAGYEVILGGEQTPLQVAATAAQEDADLIGYRIMQASPIILVRRLFESMKQHGISNVPVVVGGIIPQREEAEIRACGVREMFHPLTPLKHIVERIAVIAAEARAARDGR
jgi:methylmalonyl-CoA mutase, C-terminal domain